MKSFLQDLVAHTYSLGLQLVKITGEPALTSIESMAEDRSVVMQASTLNPVIGIDGIFGMPNLGKLDIILKCPEYRENAVINVVTDTRNEQVVPVGLHFENETGDFENDYRFMSMEIINEKLKSVKFKGAKWDVEFEPNVLSVQRLKFQSAANSEITVFQVKTDKKNDLIFKFGDASSHAGSFIFQPAVAKLKNTLCWPVVQVLSILNLDGSMVMRISDAGALQITVNSGVAEYTYTLPAMTK